MRKPVVTCCILALSCLAGSEAYAASAQAFFLIVNQPDATVLIDESSIRQQSNDRHRIQFSYLYYTYDAQPFFVPGRGILYSPFVKVTETVNCLKWENRQVIDYRPLEPFGLMPVDQAVKPSMPTLPAHSEHVLDYACNPQQGRERLLPPGYASIQEFAREAQSLRQQAIRQSMPSEDVPPPNPVHTNEGMTAETCAKQETRQEAAQHFPVQSLPHWQDMPKKWQIEAPMQMVAQACANLDVLSGRDPTKMTEASWPTSYRYTSEWQCGPGNGIACSEGSRVQVSDGHQICDWQIKEAGLEAPVFPEGFAAGSDRYPSFKGLVRIHMNRDNMTERPKRQNAGIWISYIDHRISLEERQRRGCRMETRSTWPKPRPLETQAIAYAKPDIRISTGPSVADYAVILRTPPGKQAKVGYNLEYFLPDAGNSRWVSMEVNPLLTLNSKTTSYAFGGFQEGARCWRFHLEYFDGQTWQPYSHQTPCTYAQRTALE